MPPKGYEKSELLLGIAGDNGVIRESGKLSDVPEIAYPAEPEREYVSGYVNASGQEFAVDVSEIIPVDETTRSDLFLALACGLDINKVKRNDWRKLHNLPMKRRGYHGRRKPNNF